MERRSAMKKGEEASKGLWEHGDCLERSLGKGAAPNPGAVSGGVGAAPCGGALGGAMDNIPPSTGHLGELSEDTVHLSLWVDYGLRGHEFFQGLELCLREAQGKLEVPMPGDGEGEGGEGAQGYVDLSQVEFPDGTAGDGLGMGDNVSCEGPGSFSFGGYLWNMSPRGIGGKRNSIEGHARAFYRYVIRSGGITIGFRRERAETVSNVWVEMGSVPLAQNFGVKGLWKLVQEFFAKEGFTIEKHVISRVDMYKDIPDVHVGEFCEKMLKGCSVYRARRLGYYWEELNTGMYLSGSCYTGFSLGKNIKLRCYDKRKEMRFDYIKWHIFCDLYNGIPEVLTRVEFQLRRRALTEFATSEVGRINTVEEYLAMRGSLWRYLTSTWFRLTEKEVDRKNEHQDRSVVWSVWGVIQQVAEGGKKVVRTAKKTLRDVSACYLQALGCIVKGAVFSMERGKRDIEGVIGAFRDFVVNDVGETKFAKIVSSKDRELLGMFNDFEFSGG
jgi:hypothetical protein